MSHKSQNNILKLAHNESCGLFFYPSAPCGAHAAEEKKEEREKGKHGLFPCGAHAAEEMKKESKTNGTYKKSPQGNGADR